jgi:UTP--glucose-1-phosphate uridylyltransferase
VVLDLDHAVDPHTAEQLDRFGFDRKTFERLWRLLRSQDGAWDNTMAGVLEPPRPGECESLPPPDSEARRALADRGRDAVARGQVGLVLLAGGMATRFGGVVKAACNVLYGRTFLDLRIADARRAARDAGACVPVYIMASFATCDALRPLGGGASTPTVPVTTFTQFVSLRVTPHGELFRDPDGRLSLYATGHGDLPGALAASGLLQTFCAQGGRYLFVSNVDNVAATLDPAVLGAHLASGKSVTVEVVSKQAGDTGGTPARLNGSLQIVEAFRFPSSFDAAAIPAFSTNTFICDVEVFQKAPVLTWFAVPKTLDGRPAIQFERLFGEITAFVPSHFLHVDRDGPDGRFQPVKTPEELAQRRDAIAGILQARGVLRWDESRS